MENDGYMHSGLSANNDELKRTLNDLQIQEASLKNQIKEIKETGIIHFNPLEYYEENLKSIRTLMTNLQLHIKKSEEM